MLNSLDSGYHRIVGYKPKRIVRQRLPRFYNFSFVNSSVTVYYIDLERMDTLNTLTYSVDTVKMIP